MIQLVDTQRRKGKTKGEDRKNRTLGLGIGLLCVLLSCCDENEPERPGEHLGKIDTEWAGEMETMLRHTLPGTWQYKSDIMLDLLKFHEDGELSMELERYDTDETYSGWGEWYVQGDHLTLVEIEMWIDLPASYDNEWHMKEYIWGSSVTIENEVLYMGVFNRFAGEGNGLDGLWRYTYLEGETYSVGDQKWRNIEKSELILEIEEEYYEYKLTVTNMFVDDHKPAEKDVIYTGSGDIWQENESVYWTLPDVDPDNDHPESRETFLGMRLSDDVMFAMEVPIDSPSDEGYLKIE